MTDVISDYGELGDIDIDVYYDDHQKITYELGKYSLPFFINSKSNLKRFLDLLIDLPLVLTVSYEKIVLVDVQNDKDMEIVNVKDTDFINFRNDNNARSKRES